MNRFLRSSVAVAVAGLFLGATSSSRAAFSTGTQGLADVGTPTIQGGTSLSNATQFNFSNLFTTTAETGSYATTPGAVSPTNQSGVGLGAASLNLASPSSFMFGNAAFGMFMASSITTTFSSDQTRSFYILGTFTSGTNFGAPVTGTASFNVSFTANSTSTGVSYSDSGTLSVPASPLATAVPEPASVAMLGLGLVAAGGYAARRRRVG